MVGRWLLIEQADSSWFVVYGFSMRTRILLPSRRFVL